MMTRRRSTPSCAKIACCASPDRPAAHVWVEIGTPVAFWARADARRMFCLDAARANALGDVADEQIGRRIDAVGAEVALGRACAQTPVATITRPRERRATSTTRPMSRP